MQEDKTIIAGTALMAAVLVAVILARSRWLATWLAIVALQQGISGEIARHAGQILGGALILLAVIVLIITWRRQRR